MATAEFFVDFKRSPDKDPFVPLQHVEPRTAQPNVDSDEEPEPHTGNPFVNDSPYVRKTLGRITRSIAAQMGSQYRTHIFSVLIVKDYARLMRWDRSGVIVTERIYYSKEPEFLEFFKLYDKAAPEVRGSDQSVTVPTPVEIEAALETCSGLLDPSGPLLVVSLHNPLLHAEPHRYIVESPSSRRSILPTGRSTQTSIAYDIQRKKRVFMKDSWRIVAADTTMEGQVYQMLNQGEVKNVPYCADFCDVGEDRYHQTQTQNFVRSP